MKKLKKGFTIVELVIVIAVIAILAAVLIPVFSNVVDKANESKDTQLVRNLNTALSSDLDEHNTMYDALQAAKEYGYDVGKINASATDNEILWDSKNDCFVYLDDGEFKYIPNSKTVDVTDKGDYWVISNEISETYSTYYTGSADIYSETETSICVATNNSDIVINAPNADKVIHYSEDGGSVIIEEVDSNSYYLIGRLDYLQVAVGHVVIEDNSVVEALHIADDGADIDIDSQATVSKTTKQDGVTNAQVEIGGVAVNVAEIATTNDIGAKFFASGLGTSENPYIIETAEQLRNIDKNYENYAYYKVADGVESLDCSNWSAVRLHGNFNGNNVEILNISAALFESVGYNNTNEQIVIENFVANMHNKTGRALVRNIFNSGKTTFRNISMHGYIEGDYNMGSFYNYGTANLGGSDGADYAVEFDNATSDVTLVCTTGNAIGGMLGHGYEGTGNTITIDMDAESGYTGKMIVTGTAKGHSMMAMASNGNFILNGVEESRYDAEFNYAVTKIEAQNPTKTEDMISVNVVDGAATLKISINAQITAYDEDGNKIANLAGMTWVVSQETIDAVGDSIVVFDEEFSSATIVNDVNEEAYLSVENGVLTLHTGSSNNYETGTITLFVTQYDTLGNIVASGKISLAEIK